MLNEYNSPYDTDKNEPTDEELEQIENEYFLDD